MKDRILNKIIQFCMKKCYLDSCTLEQFCKQYYDFEILAMLQEINK